VKRLIWLIAVAGIAWSLAPAAHGQGQACPPGQTGMNPYCQVPPPRPAACSKLTSKLTLQRATIFRQNRSLSLLAPITTLASGRAQITLQAAGTTTSFSTPIDSELGRIRTTHAIKASQAALGTGIVTIRYPGDSDTRPQTVRLRAASNAARLTASRPFLTDTGFLRAGGTTTARARGAVRVQLEYVNSTDGETVTLERSATIQSGRWSLNSELSPSIRTQIAQRCGTLHSYILFTGYGPRNIRGEMRSYQVAPEL
jgi:hypothetical protein